MGLIGTLHSIKGFWKVRYQDSNGKDTTLSTKIRVTTLEPSKEAKAKHLVLQPILESKTSKKEVKEKIEALQKQTQIVAGELNLPLVNETIDLYIQKRRREGNSEIYISNIKSIWNDFCLFMHSLRIVETPAIDDTHIEKYLNNLSTNGRIKKRPIKRLSDSSRIKRTTYIKNNIGKKGPILISDSNTESEKILNDFRRFVIGEYNISHYDSVKSHHVHNYGSRLFTDGVYFQPNRSIKQVSTTTNTTIVMLKSIFKYLSKEGTLFKSPFLKDHKIKNTKDRSKRSGYTEILRKSILESVNTKPFMYHITLLAFNTGLRLGDCLKLTWKDVNLDKMIIKTLTSKRKVWVTIPISYELMSHLNDLKNKPYAGKEDSDRIFISNENITSSKFSSAFSSMTKSVIPKEELKKFDFHSIRHTFANELMRRKVSFSTIKSILGHSDLEMSLLYSMSTLPTEEDIIREMKDFENSKNIETVIDDLKTMNKEEIEKLSQFIKIMKPSPTIQTS